MLRKDIFEYYFVYFFLLYKKTHLNADKNYELFDSLLKYKGKRIEGVRLNITKV